ncbi:replication initiation protein [Clostridium tepidiprofundi DSM 19306]|uniref:Replication initiation protein n=1 Tax=Clostridium tepidiprofundi DSM 19306 TaxID=1121338 RepID=A0A151AS89_9CLOT|nr:replication initiation protein [Clostridium tepidiprofundi]KYH30450.1 replication initiation protein [Clostridium tepidiprofundi DSM 19306]
MEKKLSLKNNKVSKSNDLNLRAYKLSRIEQLFILAAISLIEPDDEEFKIYKIRIKDFIDLLDLNGQSKYYDLPKITKELMKKVIEIKRPHSLLQVNWFSSVEHKPGKGIIEVEFSRKLKPYLLNLKKDFVTYALMQVSKLSSKYAIRLYELLKQYSYRKIITFSINDFRLLVGIEDNKYPRYNNLKERVIKIAMKEINNKTDIKFEFEEIKTGRKVTGIRFYIEKNQTFKKEQNIVDQTKQEIAVTSGLQSDDVAYNTYNNSEYNEAPGEEISEYDTFEFAKNIFKDKEITGLNAKKIYDAAVKTIQRKNLNISVGEFLIKKKIIVNDYSKIHTLKRGYMATLMAAIKEDWDKPERQVAKPKDSFTNYHQRTYDFEELERKLLGWDKVETKEEDEEETAENFTKTTNEEEQHFVDKQLKKLSELRDLGILTNDEYESKKEMLLEGLYKSI